MPKPFSQIWPALRGEAERLEQTRIDLHRQKWMWIALAALSVLTGMGGFVLFMQWNWMIPTFACLFGVPFVIFAVRTPLRKIQERYAKSFKLKIVRPLALEMGFEFQPTKSIPASLFAASEFFSRPIDRLDSEDLLTGQLGSSSFLLCEIMAHCGRFASNTKQARARKFRYGPEGVRDYDTIFQGLFIVLNPPVTFRGKTFVRPRLYPGTYTPDGFEFKFMGLTGEHRDSRSAEQAFGDDFVKLNDSDFDRDFFAHSTHAAEAKSLLKPSLRRRLLNFREKISSHETSRNLFGLKCAVWLAFHGQSAYIAVKQFDHRMFDPSLGQSVTDEHSIESFYDQLQFCIDLICELKLARETAQ